MATNPDTWWELNDFLDLHDQVEAEQHGSGAWASDGLTVVTIDELDAGDAEPWP